MILVNKTTADIKPYKVASHKIWAVKPEERSQILKLDWNEAVIAPAPQVREKLTQLINEGDFFNLYPSTYNDELMQAMSAYTGMPESCLQYFGSSDSLHEYIVRAYLESGDKVLVLWPSYDNFRLTAQSTGATVHFSEMSADFAMSMAKLRADLTELKPKMAYICNPNNPTGTLISKAEVEKLLQDYPETVFLLDEAYQEFAGENAAELILSYDNLLVTRTLSKAFGLANLRFGYLIASEGNIEGISKIRNPKNITTFTQAAAAAALENPDYMWEYVAEVRKARALFTESVNRDYAGKLKAFPSRGNFVLVRCESAELKKKVLDTLADHNIFIRNVSQSASLQDCVRVTVGTCEQMQRVLSVLSLVF